MELNLSPELSHDIIDLVTKRTSLVEHVDSLRMLAVGSSHGDYGFNPAFVPDSFNLCSPSQDLRHSFLLYDKVSRMNPGIRNIVVFYSAFSAGFDLEKSSEKEKCAAMKEVFLLDEEYTDPTVLAAHKVIAGRLGSMRLERGFRGFFCDSDSPYIPDSYGVDRRAAKHMKHRDRRVENLYLVRLILAAHARKQKVLIVLPPARSDYKAALQRISANVFSSLHEVAGFAYPEPPRVLDCFNDFSFQDEWFIDFDHLQPQGPGTPVLSTRIANHLD